MVHWGLEPRHRRSRLSIGGLTVAILSFGTAFGVSSAAPAFAASASPSTVIDGCTIVTNPTPTSHTRCPGADLSGANLATTNLSYAQLNNANLSGAVLAQCTEVPPPNFSFSCNGADFTDARLTGASLAHSVPSSCLTFNATPTILSIECGSANFTGANMRRTNLTNTDLSSANFTDAQLTGATLTGANFVTCYQISAAGYQECTGTALSGVILHRADLANLDLSAVDLSGADLTGSDLSHATFGISDPFGSSPTEFKGANLTHVDLSGTNIGQADLSQTDLARADVSATSLTPANQTVPRTSSKGAVVTWPTPSAQPGATPGSCNRPSGSTFRVGTTTVKCSVADSLGHQATGAFTVTVT
jgi:uncharacterized protein YjbI with pentapeptide repeats